ncbi:MAG TPA: IPT/TIG domain-containing protein [Balneolaceae bacterium]
MKLNFTTIASFFVLGLALIVTACGDDNPVNPGSELSIASFTPASGAAGTSVTITGMGFASSADGNTVTFAGNAEAEVNSASATELTVTVPAGAQRGPISVTVNGETVTSSSDFTVEGANGGGEVPQVYQALPGTLITQDEIWSNDTTLTGPRFVLPGVTLTIEAGVTVSFAYHNNNNEDVGTIITLPGDDENFSEPRPSGRLVAVGTAGNPVVFTSERKQVASWGGIILAGEASNNIPGGLGEIEGLSQGVQYGADINGRESFKDNDDSGRLSYIRIEYSGYSIADGSELQALTLYSVGNATQLDYINIYQSVDDGIEIFGGTVDIKYLVVKGAQDDTFDYDQGWTGRGQFWVGVQTAGTPSNRGFENDGCDDQADCDGGNGPTSPQIYNVTLYGNDVANGETIYGVYLREGITGEYKNIIIANFGKSMEAPIYVEDDGTADGIGSELIFGGNISYNNASDGSSLSYYDQLGLQTLNPQFIDPASFNFALQTGSGALTSGVQPPNDGFFEQVDYSGAFGTEDWTQEGSWVRWN